MCCNQNYKTGQVKHIDHRHHCLFIIRFFRIDVIIGDDEGSNHTTTSYDSQWMRHFPRSRPKEILDISEQSKVLEYKT